MTTATPTAIEMSRTIINQIAQTVNEGGDAASARAALAEVLRQQGGAMAAATAPEPIVIPGLSVTEEFIVRPNGEKYFVRRVGDHHDVAALRELRQKKIPVMFYGAPGTGKTALIEAAFTDEGVYTIQGTGDTEFADFIGSYVQLPGGVYEWVDGPLVRAMEEGKPLYVDEITLIDPKALAGCYGVMDGRGRIRITANPERGEVVAKEGFYVIAACNPNAPGSRMSEALSSRFKLQLEVTTDYNLAKKLGAPAKMVTAAQNMQRKVEKGEMGWAPQLRELIAFREISEALGEEVALRNIIAVAPEIDRPQVQDVLSRAFGKAIAALKVE